MAAPISGEALTSKHLNTHLQDAVNVRTFFNAPVDGTDATTTIHTARDSGVSSLYFPDGTYRVSGLKANVSDQEWILAPGATIKLLDGANDHVIEVTGNRTFVRGGTVDGNKANNAGTIHGIYLNGTTESGVWGVRAQSCVFDGIRVGVNTGLDNYVAFCRALSNGQMGIRLSATLRATVMGCTARLNTASGFDCDAFTLDSSFLANRSFQNTASGIFIEDGSKDIACVGNNVRQNTLHGINCNQQVADVLESLTIVGNTVKANGQHGIRVRANIAGGTVRDVTVTGNVSMGNSTSSADTYSGILVGPAAGATCSNIVLSGNRSGDRDGSPTQHYGIEVQAGTTAVTWGPNDVDNNVSGGISDGSTGSKTSFYGAAPSTKLAVTGAKAGNAALASLVSQLAVLGLITDSTT